jgi:hypothetical protein
LNVSQIRVREFGAPQVRFEPVAVRPAEIDAVQIQPRKVRAESGNQVHRLLALFTLGAIGNDGFARRMLGSRRDREEGKAHRHGMENSRMAIQAHGKETTGKKRRRVFLPYFLPVIFLPSIVVSVAGAARVRTLLGAGGCLAAQPSDVFQMSR